MKKIILNIDGMSCSACSSSLEKYLSKSYGVNKCSVNLVLAEALIYYDDTIITINDLIKYVEEAGFESDGEKVLNNTKSEKKPLIIYSILALIILIFSMGHMVFNNFINPKDHPLFYSITLLILVIPFLIYGFDIFKKGASNIIHKMPNMDTLVTLGVSISFLYSLYSLIMIFKDTNYVNNIYFESCAIIIYFVKLGRYIDKNTKEKTTSAIKELVQITPNKAIVKVGSIEREVNIDEVNVDDILVLKSGMKVAVDGVVIEGETHVDESFITGESLPSKKIKNDNVLAGSLNIDGNILYKAVNIGSKSLISEIVRMVKSATLEKTNIERITDKICRVFVPFVILISIITLILNLFLNNSIATSFNNMISVLVVACPCALGLATPLAIVVSVGLSAKNNILIKSSTTLELAKNINVVVFDKTGTLTYGKPKVSEIFNFSNFSDNELMELACSIEDKSNHPISLAFKLFKESNNIKLREVSKFKSIDGIGLFGNIDNKKIYLGSNKLFKKLNLKNNYKEKEDYLSNKNNSIIYITTDKDVLGIIGVVDVIRNDAFDVIKKLKELNIKPIMLTGDNKITANIVAKELGIDTVIADVLPTDKAKYIKELVKDNKVMMVGDGINDAPSLASCTIGVSMSSGTDIALSSSDVVILNDNLSSIIKLINVSKNTMRIIKQNLFWAFFYNVCMIPLAMGLFNSISLSPMIASLAMMFSSLTVSINSLRLKKERSE